MRRAFTLVELLVVVAVIGILAAVVIVSMSGGTDKAKITKGQAFSAKIGEELAGSLVSEWRFDEGMGLIANDAWGVNSGTLSDSSMWRSGGDCVSGKCLEFNGTNDYVDCGSDNSLDITNAITIEAWIKPSSFTDYDAIIAKLVWPTNAEGYSFRVMADRSLVWRAVLSGNNSYSITSNSTMTIDNWYHIVLTHDASYTCLYINGISDKEDTPGGTIVDFSKGLKVGWDDYAVGRNFDGLIDEVRIYNSAATITQIQSQYLAGLDKLLSNGAISKSEYNQRVKKIVLE